MQSSDSAFRSSASRQSLSDDDVRAELERILASPDLEASGRRRTFLRFIVEETLAGRDDRLKGHTVAVAVFGRDETFDSQADPVVRLEARRLRRDLDSYYMDAGNHDPVRISIPKGGYVPHFEWYEVAQPHPLPDEGRPSGASEPTGVGAGNTSGRDSSVRSTFGWSPTIAALVAMVVAVAIAGWALMAGQVDKGPSATSDLTLGPSVVVLPFEALGSTDDSHYLANGLSQELVNNLMRFPGFRLYTLPIGVDENAGAEPARLARSLDVAYVVSGNVRADAENARVATQLFDAVTGRVLWSATYDRPSTPEALIAVQDDLAGEIATALGQPYGVIDGDLSARAARAGVSNMQSYVCVLRAYDYRRNFSREKFDPVLSCLEESVRRDPAYSDAWAMLGWLHLDAGRYEFFGTGKLQEEYAKALQAASQALLLEPDNTLALKALSSINHYMGRFEEGERLARRAVELNPHDPDALGQFGWRLAVRGKFDEGIPILERAIARSVNPPGWYFHLIAIDLYMKGDYGQMLKIAERSGVNGSGVSQALIAIANGAIGNGDAARVALEKMAASGPLARDPAANFHRHGATDEIVAALMAGLEKAHEIASR